MIVLSIGTEKTEETIPMLRALTSVGTVEQATSVRELLHTRQQRAVERPVHTLLPVPGG
jgi:hypothetical protein